MIKMIRYTFVRRTVVSNLTDDEAKRYDKMAADHADFLCYKIFKPAFMMAFIHGAKHMKEDLMSDAGCVKEKVPNPNWNDPQGTDKQQETISVRMD